MKRYKFGFYFILYILSIIISCIICCNVFGNKGGYPEAWSLGYISGIVGIRLLDKCSFNK